MRLRLLSVKKQQPFPSARIGEIFGCFCGLDVVHAFLCAQTRLLRGLVFALTCHGHTGGVLRVVGVPQSARASLCVPGLFLAIQICFSLSHTDKACKCSQKNFWESSVLQFGTTFK